MDDEFKRLPNEFLELEKISTCILMKIADILKDNMNNLNPKDSVFIVSRSLKILLQSHIDSILNSVPSNEFVAKQTLLYILHPCIEMFKIKDMEINETNLH